MTNEISLAVCVKKDNKKRCEFSYGNMNVDYGKPFKY